MPRHLQDWPAYAGPGMVTGLLGVVLLGMAAGLGVRALRRPGAGVTLPLADARRYLADPRTRRLALMAGLSLAYLVSLGRGWPYQVTTGAFLIAAMLLFNAARWWVVLLVSVATAAVIAAVFNRLFLVPLP